MTSHAGDEQAHAEVASHPDAASEVREQKRWLTFFGSPALVAAVFVGVSFGTGQEWYLGLAVAAIIADIGIMVWLALSSDTNARPRVRGLEGAAARAQGGASAEVREQKRWLTFFGSPALVAAVFVGVSFGTGQEWYLGLAVAAIIADIGIMVWLALSSDTNARPGSSAAPHH